MQNFLLRTVIIISFLGIDVLAMDVSFMRSELVRTQADQERDKTSKPEAIVGFAKVEPGESVLDLFGGGGYYSEILANVVGPKGNVTLHNNKAYLSYVGKELATRLDGERLPNVEKIISESEALNLGTARFDTVFFVLGYHDLYFRDTGWSVSASDVLPQVFRALKPGGFLLIIDHSAKAGTGIESVQKLHRIDELFVKAEVPTYGFEFVAESNQLRIISDKRNMSVFDEKMRRKTDRFVLLFKKPI